MEDTITLHGKDHIVPLEESCIAACEVEVVLVGSSDCGSVVGVVVPIK